MKGNPGVNQVTLPTSTWKKVLLLPGSDGGGVYWTVIGAKKDKSTVAGNIFSFEVAGAEPVANPAMSNKQDNLSASHPILGESMQYEVQGVAWK